VPGGKPRCYHKSMRQKFARFAWFVLAVQIVVILWGAFVRASKSGAGCGEHWPLCQGELLPRAPELPTIIEFTHRITSGLALVVVAVLVVRAFRLFPAGHIVRKTAAWSGVFMIGECLIGAALVLLGHTALNPSLSRGITLSIHLINTLLLLAALTLTAWWARRDPAQPAASVTPSVRRSLALAGAGLIVAGVVGAIAALGDTLYTATTLAQGVQQDFAAEAHPFVRIRILHPILAVIAGFYLVVAAVRIMSAKEAGQRVWYLGIALIALVVTQFGIGTLNIILLVPIPMQIVHLLFADALWITYVLFSAEVVRPLAAAERTEFRLAEAAGQA